MLFLIEDGDYEDRTVYGVFSGEDQAKFDALIANYRRLYVQHHTKVGEASQVFNRFNRRPLVPDRPNGVKKRVWDGHPLMVEYRLQMRRWSEKWQEKYKAICAEYPLPDLLTMLNEGGYTEVNIHRVRV